MRENRPSSSKPTLHPLSAVNFPPPHPSPLQRCLTTTTHPSPRALWPSRLVHLRRRRSPLRFIPSMTSLITSISNFFNPGKKRMATVDDALDQESKRTRLDLSVSSGDSPLPATPTPATRTIAQRVEFSKLMRGKGPETREWRGPGCPERKERERSALTRTLLRVSLPPSRLAGPVHNDRSPWSFDLAETPGGSENAPSFFLQLRYERTSALAALSSTLEPIFLRHIHDRRPSSTSNGTHNIRLSIFQCAHGAHIPSVQLVFHPNSRLAVVSIVLKIQHTSSQPGLFVRQLRIVPAAT